MIYKIIDPVIAFGLRFGCPDETVHPQWLCRIVHSFFDRWEAVHIDAPFFAAQAAGLGITRRFFAAPANADEVVAWIDQEFERTPVYVGLDVFRVFLFAADTTSSAQFDNTSLRQTWTGTRSEWETQRPLFVAAITTNPRGTYAIVNAAGVSLSYSLQFT